MSVTTEPHIGSTAADLPADRERWFTAAVRALRLPRRLVLALVCSRILVAVAGAIGVGTMSLHASPAFKASMRTLGWLGNLLAGSTDRFDSGYYLSIAERGYGTLQSGKIAFFPVYPMLIRVVAWLTLSPVLAGVLVSGAAFAVALVLLHRLTELELGPRAADMTVLLLCFAPLSFFFTAIYSESIFLALTVGSLLAARNGRWRLACTLAAAATLTRPTGIVLVGALLVVRWRERGGMALLRRPFDRETLWVAMAPMALVGWLLALTAMGYGLTGEFHVEHTLWYRETMNPLQGLVTSLAALVHGAIYVAQGHTVFAPSKFGPFTPAAQDLFLGLILIATLIALEGCRRRMRPEYFTYAGLAILMCLSSPEQGEPLWSYDRFALTMFPLWMVGGAWLARRPRLVQGAVLLAGAGALVFYTLQFSSWAFVA